jgi:hypothetical protein
LGAFRHCRKRNAPCQPVAVRSWRGDDPVSALYRSIFSKELIIDLPNDEKSKKDQLADFERRIRNQIPPGYKDGGKDDGGVGDVFLWLTLLQIGSQRRTDLVFVTGEEKADWFNRTDNRASFPRYELVDEYRRHSGGGALSLISLHEFLELMKLPAEVLSEVRSAEKDARRAVDVL